MRYELTETISEILGVDIVERQVNAMVLCQFHDEDSPSLSINLETGLWQCFGCGKKGNLESLARMLGEELNDDIKFDQLIKSTLVTPTERKNFAPLANGYIAGLETERGQAALKHYLEPRGIPGSVASHFGIGYDDARDCLTSPYWDDDRVTGIKFRTRDGFKYSHPDSQYGLYNVNDLRGRPVVVIFEGEGDTLYGYSRLCDGMEHGQRAWRDSPANNNRGRVQLEANVGVGGTSGAVKSERLWRLWGLDLLFAKKIILAYDNDEAGGEACNVAERILGDKVIRMQPTMGKDWTEAGLAGENLVSCVRELASEGK